MNYKHKIKTNFIVIFVLFWSIILIFALVKANSSTEIKEGRIIIKEPTQSGSFFVSANISENQIKSPVLRTDFPFNALFVKWQAENGVNLGQNFDIYVKFLNESWTDWLKIRLDDDINGKNNSDFILASQMIPTKLTDTFQYKIIFDPHTKKPALKNLEFAYLNTTKGHKLSYKISSRTNSTLNIISRAQWGANPNYKFDEKGQDLWEEEYYLPKKFIIHHTAGENANTDPMATIRAIQHWHAVARGWGDIGYNYLIDSKGNIYEGRAGGDGIVGGHAYMRNRNTIGIAILGCYQSQKSDLQGSNCNTPDKLTENSKTALNKLIAQKSREFNIDPLGQSEFHGQILPNVIGHNDVGNTACPGDLIYDKLPQTRQLAYNLLQELGGYQKPLPASAQFVRISTKELDIEETKTADVIVEFKNTGQAVWRGYEDAGLFITDDSIKNKLAQIGSVHIALNTNTDNEPLAGYKLLEGNVYPGEIGKFRLTLSPPINKKTISKDFTLAWQNKGYFPNSDFSITINKIPCTTCQLENKTNSPIYNGVPVQSTFPRQMPADKLQPILMQFKNTGNQNWDQDKLKLHIIYEKEHISPFRNNSWYSEYALIPPKEKTIAPNSLATFEFKLKAPNLVAPFPHNLTLLYNDQKLYKFDQTIEVISPYAAQITENTLPVAVKTNWRPAVKLTFKNTGSKTWDNPILKSYDIDYTNSWFRDWSWHDNKTIEKSWQEIAPGEEITFEFKIKPYWKANTYPHVYKLFDDQQEIYINAKKEFLTYTRVDR